MPKNGDSLSILGFGCMRLPMQDGVIDEARAIRQIRHAIDQGVNYVDTAWPYHAGASELLLAKALKDGYRERVKLATKLPSWMIESREDMDRFLAAQLKKLETDHIDYTCFIALMERHGTTWCGLAFLTLWMRQNGMGALSTRASLFTGLARTLSESWMRIRGSSARFSTTSWTRNTRRARRA